MEEKQESLFNLEEYTNWHKEWQDMPEFVQEDLTPYRSVVVHFENEEDIAEFSRTVGQKITPLTKSLWFPELTIEKAMNKRYLDNNLKEGERHED